MMDLDLIRPRRIIINFDLSPNQLQSNFIFLAFKVDAASFIDFPGIRMEKSLGDGFDIYKV